MFCIDRTRITALLHSGSHAEHMLTSSPEPGIDGHAKSSAGGSQQQPQASLEMSDLCSGLPGLTALLSFHCNDQDSLHAGAFARSVIVLQHAVFACFRDPFVGRQSAAPSGYCEQHGAQCSLFVPLMNIVKVPSTPHAVSQVQAVVHCVSGQGCWPCVAGGLPH